MSTPVKTGSQPYPWALGKVLPGAAYATASVPLTQNIQPVNADGTPDKMFNGIYIQASPKNTGICMYVCSNASPPDEVNFTNVLAFLPPGTSYPRSKDWANNRDITALYIGADNATDFVIVSVDSF